MGAESLHHKMVLVSFDVVSSASCVELLAPCDTAEWVQINGPGPPVQEVQLTIDRNAHMH
jgi:hypothetical protein